MSDQQREPMPVYKIRLPPEMRERLEREATFRGMKWTAYARMALENRLDRDEDRRNRRHDGK